MKTSVISIGALASVALAHPLDERGWFPSWLIPAPNPATTTTAAVNSRWSWPFHTSSAAAVQTTTTTLYTTTTAVEAIPTPTPSTTTTTTSQYTQPTTTLTTTTRPVAASSTSNYVPSSTTSTQATSTSGVDWSDGDSYGQPILDQHNIHRANHSVTNLTWDDDIAATALKIAQLCIYAHNTTIDGGGYGQNIGAGYKPSQVPGMVTNGMYNNEMMSYPGYDSEPSMDNFHAWGHFTQIVWKGSARVGCATHYCGAGGLANVGSNVAPYFTVCNFKPAGNYVGQFHSNVFAPLGDPLVIIPNAW